MTKKARSLRPTRLGSIEQPVLLTALALITVHLVDLSGLSSLGSVLVVLGLPAIVALTYPRLRRSGRVALALIPGLLTFGTGLVSAGFHTVNFGFEWSDLTGLGYAAGGLALVGLGLGVAIRRAGDQPSVRGRRRALRALGTLVAIPVLFVFLFMPLFFALFISHPIRLPLDSADLGRPYDEVSFKAEDGTRLAGWYVPSRNGAAVIVMHGSGGNRGGSVRHARMYARHGYGVLLFDQRGHGASGGHGNLLGWNAYPDVEAAIDFVQHRPGVRHVAAHGLSMGGEVLLGAAARDRRIEALVSDGAERVEEEAPLSFDTLEAVGGQDAPEPLAEATARIAPRPVLLISSDRRKGESDSNEVFRRSIGASATHWAIPDAGHTAGLRVHPAEYEARAVGFMDRALGLR
jgi:pimeloyl-ACP methyl ester carboxylesterase